MNTPRQDDEDTSEKSGDSFQGNPVNEILDFGHLLQGQKQFFECLYSDPRIEAYQRYWTVKPADLNLQMVEASLQTLSTGEAHMLRFLAGIWLGSNTYEFDLIEATKSLDERSLSFIQDWIKSPYFP